MKNLSIRYKLLLGFMLLAMLMLASNIYTLHNLGSIKNDITNLATSAPRIQALLEMRNLSYRANELTAALNRYSRQSTESINQSKDELLALLEEIDSWQIKYQRDAPLQNNNIINMAKLKLLRDHVVLMAITAFQKEEQNAPRSVVTKSKVDLNTAVENLNIFLKNAVLAESNLILVTEKNTLSTTNEIYMITIVANMLVFIIAIILSLLLTRIISYPIIRLKSFAQQIDYENLESATPIQSTRTNFSHNEIDELSNAINVMLTHLSKARSELIIASHAAGASEVATSVLHNIGNVLNSVNTSAAQLDRALKSKDLPRLKKMISLIEEQKDNLTEYMRDDAQGKQLIELLYLIENKMETENNLMQQELTSLVKMLNHINQVISMQQSIEKSVGIYEKLSIEELIDEIITMNSKSISNANISIVKHITNIPPIRTIKYKFQQVLINLIKNAIESLKESNPAEKKLTISTRLTDDILHIEITDNGTGIDTQNLVKIFSFGFTTKIHGHGYGLHNSALLMTEIGGELTAKSNGPGQGATFMIDLPLTTEVTKQKSARDHKQET